MLADADDDADLEAALTKSGLNYFATAEAAITDALRLRADKLAYVALAPGNYTDLLVDVGHVVGTVVRRDGTVITSRIVVVKIANIGGRIVVRTAFVGNP